MCGRGHEKPATVTKAEGCLHSALRSPTQGLSLRSGLWLVGRMDKAASWGADPFTGLSVAF